jgi:hypothetical protein
MSADERGALSADVDAELAEVAASGTPLGAAAAESRPLTPKEFNAVLGKAEDDEPLPLLLRPLEWLNAPLAACPSWVRDAIGKAAIITMINAVAVLTYVAFFRR